MTILLARPETVPDGVRLAVKDLFDTAGLETTYGAGIFAGHVPRETAPAVRLLEDAGYAVVGKANLHEFAYGTTSENPHFGDVESPRFPGRVAGGSSGGSAAAVAAGLADAALGTDSAGSIRIPAACCGVVGHKPTHGLVPLEGCWPLAASFDTAGPLAHDVDGCERMLATLAPGFTRRRLASLEEIEVGVAWVDLAEPRVRARVEAALAAFPRLRPVELPFPRQETYAVFMREVADVHRELFAESAGGYGEDVRIKVERCLAVTDAAVARGARLRAEYAERVETALAGVDLVVTPTLPVEPPRLRRRAAPGDLDVREQLIRFTYPFSALGWPATAVGGVQVAGRGGDDGLVLAAARLVSPV